MLDNKQRRWTIRTITDFNHMTRKSEMQILFHLPQGNLEQRSVHLYNSCHVIQWWKQTRINITNKQMTIFEGIDANERITHVRVITTIEASIS
jgi:hypothetical protein